MLVAEEAATAWAAHRNATTTICRQFTTSRTKLRRLYPILARIRGLTAR